jgi:uncharacterized surface protein with fasciclin (FAS1) repeats
MKSMRQISKYLLVGLIGLTSVSALSACSQSETTPTAEETPTEQVGDVAATPEATTTPATTASDTAGKKDVVAVAAADSSLSTFTKAVAAAGLTEQLEGEGPYTVFAPTDEAFAALPAGTLDNLLKPENKEQLVKILSYHVVPKQVTSTEIESGEVATAEGSDVTVEKTASAVKVNEALVVMPDIVASNGVIHAIDKVMLPPDLALDSTDAPANATTAPEATATPEISPEAEVSPEASPETTN